MRLGIDLGTTRTVVAVSDRGNYPIVGFTTAQGDVSPFIPTISADDDGELVHGLAAEEAALRGAPHMRSWKRLLARSGPEERVCIGRHELNLLELTTSFLKDMAHMLRHASNVPCMLENEALPEIVISVPANAHSGQRLTTLEAFRRAGFTVRAMINEPSAAAIEYAHRYRNRLNSKRDHVLIYDLGGGTFDAALVSVAGDDHTIVDTSGIQELGGDDFDALLLEMALEAIGLPKDITHPRLPALLDECRSAKEGVGPNTKRIVLELAALGREAPDAPVVLAVKDYYERLRPYVEHTMRALAEVMAPGSEGGAERVRDLDGLKVQAAEAGVAGVYVVGGGSGLPVVPRLLRERFAHRVQRSVYPSASTAIGLAIAADDEHPGPTLRERFTRHLGVFREKEAGHGVVFDQIFSRGTPMPSQDGPPLVKTRTYRAAHNIGYFRFVECAALGDGLEPVGDISPHGEVRFPFLREVRHDPLDRTPIERLSGDGPMIEERYEVDGTGIIAVTIRDLDDGYTQRYVLG